MTASRYRSVLKKSSLLCKCWAPVLEHRSLVLGLFFINPEKPGDKSPIKLKLLEEAEVALWLANVSSIEYFSRLPFCMTDITVNSAVFLLNTHNVGIEVGRRRLMYCMSLLHLLHLATLYFIMHFMFVKALDVKAAVSYHLPFVFHRKPSS